MAKTDLRTDAKVEVVASTDTRNHTTARVIIDDEYEHMFPATSRVSKALDLMTPVALQERLDGGAYFFINGCLFDFRDGNYNGFIHTPDNIDALKNTIGINLESGRRSLDNTQSNARLSKVWSSQSIQVPGMDDGGAFNSQLTFTWNPFVETIRSSFDIERLICSNGMTGMTSLFSAKIPLINRWEEHLDIADMQIQNKLYAMLSERFRQMADERATLSDVLRLQDHIVGRLQSYRNGSDRVSHSEQLGRNTRLRNLNKVVDPSTHLREHYRENAFKDRRLAAQLPSHLSMFDAYNIATEISSHTTPTNVSSNHALDKFANELVFDRQDRSQHAARFGGVQRSAFSDPDQAFFGDIDEDDS